EVEVHFERGFAPVAGLSHEAEAVVTHLGRHDSGLPGEVGVEVDGKLDEYLLAYVHSLDVFAVVLPVLPAELLGGRYIAATPGSVQWSPAPGAAVELVGAGIAQCEGEVVCPGVA